MKRALTNRRLLTLAALSLFAMPAFGQCPIPDGGTLFVKAPLGNIIIDTSGTGAVEVQVTHPDIEVEESCFDDRVEISGVDPERVYENVDWNFRVPASVDLDLVTLAGSIRIQNTRGGVIARTEGGSITVGDIGGAAAISTQGGSIVAGDIGGTAEIRSLGGEIRIGRVGGNAELTTAGGPITVGPVAGSVRAETAGGTISIEEARGSLVAITQAGDIMVGTAGGRVQAQTGGGNIVAAVVRGPFRGFTDFGDIQINRAESSIDATSRKGDVEATLAPESYDGDLHVMLEASAGSTRLRMPGDMPASLEATVDRNVLREPQLRSDFRLESTRSRNVPGTLSPQFTVPSAVFVGEINGGGHVIHLRSSGGEVEIRRLPR
jgi:DUF4097 and DUF4098 domain-containing protein YvlB